MRYNTGRQIQDLLSKTPNLPYAKDQLKSIFKIDVRLLSLDKFLCLKTNFSRYDIYLSRN